MEELIKIEDRNRIENIKFKYPELMAEGAEEAIKSIYATLLDTENKLHKTRDLVRSLELKQKELQEKWRELQILFTYSHPAITKTITKETCSLAIKGHGNDIIGRTTVM